MKQQKKKPACAKSALDSGDPKMKQSTKRQKYVDFGGRKVLRTELYFIQHSLLCNLVCFIHLKT